MKIKVILCIAGILFLFHAPLTMAQLIDKDLAAGLQETYGLNAELLNKALSSVGDSSGGSPFSLPNLVGCLIFGCIGLVAFVYGKKEKNFKPLFIGLILMVYPYVLWKTFWLYAVGIGLCGLLYFWRD